jgi:hypothetical protein
MEESLMNLIRISAGEETQALSDYSWITIPSNLFSLKELIYMGEDDCYKYYVRKKP